MPEENSECAVVTHPQEYSRWKPVFASKAVKCARIINYIANLDGCLFLTGIGRKVANQAVVHYEY